MILNELFTVLKGCPIVYYVNGFRMDSYSSPSGKIIAESEYYRKGYTDRELGKLTVDRIAAEKMHIACYLIDEE